MVVPGDQLQQWMLGRGRTRLTQEQADAVFAAFDRQVIGRDRHEGGGRPLPRTAAHACRALGLGATAATGALLTVGWLAQQPGAGPLAVGVLLAAVGGSELVARRTDWSWEARAGQATLALVVALAFGRVFAA